MTTSSAARNAPPPYSCTRERAFAPAGVTSRGAVSGAARITATRPPSSGRLSDHQQAAPLTWGPDNETRPAANATGVSGDGQVPKGARRTGAVGYADAHRSAL